MRDWIAYFLLAIVTTRCVLIEENGWMKKLDIVSALCWWLLTVGEIVSYLM